MKSRHSERAKRSKNLYRDASAKKPQHDRGLYRILDANFNRAKEGLRVCEDICRYAWDNKPLTKSYKDVRHGLTQVGALLSFDKALAARDIAADVGTLTTASERKRKDLGAVFGANSQRVKESLRVVEEVAKLLDKKAAQNAKSLRYKVYELEQKAFRSFP